MDNGMYCVYDLKSPHQDDILHQEQPIEHPDLPIGGGLGHPVTIVVEEDSLLTSCSAKSCC